MITDFAYSSSFAGADTTAIALRSVLYHLMRDSIAYSKLTAEIDEAANTGKISDSVSYAKAIKLPYLNAVIKETMRLHSSVGLTMPRHVPAGGATISGFYFPEGYRVGIDGAVVHYNKDVFGPDAHQFKPDRWYERDTVEMDKAMIQFGSGARTCIGKDERVLWEIASSICATAHINCQISLSEIHKLVPQLLKKFKFRLQNPQREWKTYNYWFNKQTNIFVIVGRRRLAKT